MKSLSEGCSTLGTVKISGHDHRTIKRYIANERHKLTAIDLRRVKCEATRNPLSSSVLPELQPTWSTQKYKMLSAQRHGHGKEGWNQTITEQDTSWTVNLQWRKTEHLSEQYLEAVVAAGKKVDHQQIKKSERLHEWKAYGSSWKPGWLYWPLIYFLKYSGLRFIHILDWPRAL